MQYRDSYYDVLRGIALICVIAIHTYTPSSIDIFSISLMFRNICNSAVPIFIAVGGYFYFLKKNNVKPNYKNNLLKQFKFVYIPTLIWSLPYFYLTYIDQHDLSFGTLATLLFSLIACGYSIYYFVAVIFQCYILAPLFEPNKKNLCISLGVTILCVGLSTFCVSVVGLNIPLIIYAGPCVVWIAFWMLGAYCAQHELKINLPASISVLLIMLFVSQIETCWLYPFNGFGLGIKPSSHAFSICLIFILFSSNIKHLFSFDHPINKALAYIGRRSFGIYLIHLYVFRLSYRFMQNIWPVNIILLLFLSLLIVAASRFLLKDHSKYIGFR